MESAIGLSWLDLEQRFRSIHVLHTLRLDWQRNTHPETGEVLYESFRLVCPKQVRAEYEILADAAGKKLAECGMQFNIAIGYMDLWHYWIANPPNGMEDRDRAYGVEGNTICENIDSAVMFDPQIKSAQECLRMVTQESELREAILCRTLKLEVSDSPQNVGGDSSRDAEKQRRRALRDKAKQIAKEQGIDLTSKEAARRLRWKSADNVDDWLQCNQRVTEGACNLIESFYKNCIAGKFSVNP